MDDVLSLARDDSRIILHFVRAMSSEQQLQGVLVINAMLPVGL